MSDSLWRHESQHARPPCPSPTPGVHANSCPSSQWCHPTISSSIIPFSSCLQSFPASGSFPMIQFFASGGQSIGASASVLPMNIQCWFPLGLTGLISLQSKGLSRVFSSTTVLQRAKNRWSVSGGYRVKSSILQAQWYSCGQKSGERWWQTVEKVLQSSALRKYPLGRHE